MGIGSNEQHKGEEKPAAEAEDTSLLRFTADVFGHLPRVDQRRWAHAYLAALIHTQGKKSVRRLADTISTSPEATAQSLRQFVNLSPWDWRTAQHELTRWTAQHGPATAWTVGRALLPKRGQQSVGVQRHFDPSSGQTLNSQLGFGAFLRVGATDVPVSWQLCLPPNWIHDPRLRRRARIPEGMGYRPPWAHVLRLVDTLAGTTSTASPVVADMSDDPDAPLLVQALMQRGHSFVVGVSQRFKVYPAQRSTQTVPISSAEGWLSSGAVRDLTLTRPDGTRHRTRVLATSVYLPHLRAGDAPARPHQLFVECAPRGQRHPIWLSTLPEHRLPEAASFAALATSTASTVTELAGSFGLHDFEGRSFPGWHHHMTLVSAAYAYQRLHRPRPLGAAPHAQRSA